MSLLTALILLVSIVIRSTSSEATPVILQSDSTHRICQLTGETDLETSLPTINQTETKYHLRGTDLGYSFEHDGKLVFLFGDTASSGGSCPTDCRDPSNICAPFDPNACAVPRFNVDSIAISSDSQPDDCVALNFVVDPSGPGGPNTFHPPTIINYPNLGDFCEGHEEFCVPSQGFSGERTCADGTPKMYVFYSRNAGGGDIEHTALTILTASCDGGSTLDYLYDFSTDKFINGSTVIVDNDTVPGLPDATGKGVLVWGSAGSSFGTMHSLYRMSNMYLAYAPLSDVEHRTAWRYYRHPAVAGDDSWVANEADATPLLDEPTDPNSPPDPNYNPDLKFQRVLGELSVTWNPYLAKWLLLYNCNGGCADIRFQVADLPWGPWSHFVPQGHLGATVLLDRASTLGHYVHDVQYYGHCLGGPNAAAVCNNDSVCPGSTCSCTQDADCSEGDICNSYVDFYTPANQCKEPNKHPICAHPNDRLYDFAAGCSRRLSIGDLYAPYVIDRFTAGDALSTTIYYTLSTWDPYQTMLMKSTLKFAQADVALTKTHTPDRVAPGAQLTYHYTVTNHGPDPALGVSVTDVLPLEVTFGGTPERCVENPPGTIHCSVDDVAAGQTQSFDVVVTVSPTLTRPTCDRTFVSNSASVTTASIDPDPTNNSASTVAEIAFPLRHFQCYEVDGHSFEQSDVGLDGSFGQATVELGDLKRFCNPADKNGEDELASSDACHLTGYRVLHRVPRLPVARDQVIVNQFGTVTVDLARPNALLVPTAKDRNLAPAALVDPAIDRFECRAVLSGRTRVAGVSVIDQFGALIDDVQRPIRLCSPVATDDQPIIDPDHHLACYKVRTTPPRPIFSGPFFIANAFQDQQLDVTRSREFCVPSLVNPTGS